MDDEGKENMPPRNGNNIADIKHFWGKSDHKKTPEELLRYLKFATKQFENVNKKRSDHGETGTVIHALFQMLRDSISSREEHKLNRICDGSQAKWEYCPSYKNSPETCLRFLVVCTALEIELRRSKILSETHAQGLITNEVIICLSDAAIMCLLKTNENAEQTVGDLILSKLSRIIYLVTKHVLFVPIEIVRPLQELVVYTSSSDVRINAACSVATLTLLAKNLKKRRIRKVLMSMSKVVISIFSTAIRCLASEQKPQIIIALLKMAKSSQVSLIDISERRDIVLHLATAINDDDECRHTALIITAMLLSCKESSKTLCQSSVGLALANSSSFVAAGYSSKGSEVDGELAVAVIISILKVNYKLLPSHQNYLNQGWQLRQLRAIMDTLTSVAHFANSKQIQKEAVVGVCWLLKQHNNKTNEESRHLYPTVIDFMSPCIVTSASVRREALETLELCCRCEAAAILIFSEYSFLDNMTQLLARYHQESINIIEKEHNTLIDILYKCSNFESCSELICCDQELLGKLILNSLYGMDTIVNQKHSSILQTKLLKVLLQLLKVRSNHQYFKEHAELLPLFATAASLQEEKELKQQLIGAILDLSQLYLYQGIPNRFMV